MSKCKGRWIDRRTYEKEIKQRVDPDLLTIGSFWAVRLSLLGSNKELPAAEFPVQPIKRNIGSEVGSRILKLSFVDPDFRPTLTVVTRTKNELIVPPMKLIVIDEGSGRTYEVDGGYFTKYKDFDGFEEEVKTDSKTVPVEPAVPLPGELIMV